MFRKTITLFAVFAMALAAGYLFIKPEPAKVTESFELPFAANAQSTDPNSAEETVIEEMVLGNPDAPLTVIEYASFTCPHCASFHQVFCLLKTFCAKASRARENSGSLTEAAISWAARDMFGFGDEPAGF